MNNNFIDIAQFSKDEIISLLDLAADLKAKTKVGKCPELLKNKTLGMIFEKPSTRTRVSFEVAMVQCGGNALLLGPEQVSGKRESLHDVAKTLSRYVDGIMLRTYAHKTITEIAKYADVPVVNGLSDYNHPCQAMADILTLYEHKGRRDDLVLSYVGDGNNVLLSLINICVKLGIKIKAGCPDGYFPDESFVEKAKSIAGDDMVVVTSDPLEAASGADAVYTDVWASMGQEDEAIARKKIFAPYQLNETLLSHAKKDAIVLHCLPAHRGEEITDGVVDSKQSVVFDQAENRLHAQKAILVSLMKNS